jgi:hypothetical protein
VTRDIIDRIQEGQEEKSSTISSAADIIGMLGMLPFWAGLLQMFSVDEIAKLNGIVTFVISVMVIGVTWYAPGLAAAYHVPGKKYLRNHIFYGKRMITREMEVLHDPQVIARMVTEEDKGPVITTLEREDDEYETIMRALGADFLTDTQVDEKINQALKDRYDKIKAEGEERKLSDPRTWWRRGEKEAEITWSDNTEDKKK